MQMSSFSLYHDLRIVFKRITIFRLNKKSVKSIKKWTEKIWTHTSQNGLFVTVWPGDKNQNAFVGISLNKAKIPAL